MNGPDILASHEDLWVTSMGKWFPGERVVLRGKDMLNDLIGIRWMEQLLFSITGRRFSDEQVRLFEGIWSMTVSYPDPRIWPNRVAALGATARTTATLGVTAALAMSEALTFGHRSKIKAIDFIIKTKKKIDNGECINKLVEAELKAQRSIAGYGRVFVRNDERIEPLLKFAKSLGCGDGPHVKLVFEIEKVLIKKRYRMCMNTSALGAALGADQGLTARQHYHYSMLSFQGGMVSAFLDAQEKPEGAFFPLRCEKLKYGGPKKRQWH